MSMDRVLQQVLAARDEERGSKSREDSSDIPLLKSLREKMRARGIDVDSLSPTSANTPRTEKSPDLTPSDLNAEKSTFYSNGGCGNAPKFLEDTFQSVSTGITRQQNAIEQFTSIRDKFRSLCDRSDAPSHSIDSPINMTQCAFARRIQKDLGTRGDCYDRIKTLPIRRRPRSLRAYEQLIETCFYSGFCFHYNGNLRRRYEKEWYSPNKYYSDDTLEKAYSDLEKVGVVMRFIRPMGMKRGSRRVLICRSEAGKAIANAWRIGFVDMACAIYSFFANVSFKQSNKILRTHFLSTSGSATGPNILDSCSINGSNYVDPLDTPERGRGTGPPEVRDKNSDRIYLKTSHGGNPLRSRVRPSLSELTQSDLEEVRLAMLGAGLEEHLEEAYLFVRSLTPRLLSRIRCLGPYVVTSWKSCRFVLKRRSCKARAPCKPRNRTCVTSRECEEIRSRLQSSGRAELIPQAMVFAQRLYPTLLAKIDNLVAYVVASVSRPGPQFLSKGGPKGSESDYVQRPREDIAAFVEKFHDYARNKAPHLKIGVEFARSTWTFYFHDRTGLKCTFPPVYKNRCNWELIESRARDTFERGQWRESRDELGRRTYSERDLVLESFLKTIDRLKVGYEHDPRFAARISYKAPAKVRGKRGASLNSDPFTAVHLKPISPFLVAFRTIVNHYPACGIDVCMFSERNWADELEEKCDVRVVAENGSDYSVGVFKHQSTDIDRCVSLIDKAVRICRGKQKSFVSRDWESAKSKYLPMWK